MPTWSYAMNPSWPSLQAWGGLGEGCGGVGAPGRSPQAEHLRALGPGVEPGTWPSPACGVGEVWML